MLELRFLYFIFKKSWYIFFFIFLYQIILTILFISELKSSADSLSGWISQTNIFKNLDLIFLGMFIFPLIVRKISRNDFYNNYLLKNNNYFKSKLKIIVYFIIALFLIAFIKKVIFYYISYLLINSFELNINTINFEVSLFGDIHLVISSLFLGKILTFLRIKKIWIFQSCLFILFIFILVFFFLLAGMSLIKWRSNQSTDYISQQGINIIFTIKSILLFTPLSGGITLNSSANFGDFSTFYNFATYAINNERELLELKSHLAIWITVSFFIYIILLFLFCYFNKVKIIQIKNIIKTFYFKNKLNNSNMIDSIHKSNINW